jgi:hypothetical protein
MANDQFSMTNSQSPFKSALPGRQVGYFPNFGEGIGRQKAHG